MSPKQNQQRNKAVFLFGLCPQKINNHLKTNIINGYYEQYSRLHMKIKIKQIVEKFHRNISLFCVILKVCKLFVWLPIKCQKFCWNILWLKSQFAIMLSRTVRRQKENHSQWSWIYIHIHLGPSISSLFIISFLAPFANAWGAFSFFSVLLHFNWITREELLAVRGKGDRVFNRWKNCSWSRVFLWCWRR